MKGNKLNIVQLVAAVLGIVLMCILPYAAYKIDLILMKLNLFSYSGLQMALNINPVMLIAFLILALELICAFTDNKALGLLVGAVGVVAGIVFMLLIPVLMKNSNGLWIFDKVKELLALEAQYHFLPESIAAAIPAEVTPENVTMVQNFVLDGIRAGSGAWVYIFTQIIYAIGCLMGGGSGSSKSSRKSAPSSY